VLGLSLLLLGCLSPDDAVEAPALTVAEEALPTLGFAAIELADHSRATILVRLDDPRRDPVLRYAPGLAVLNAEGLWRPSRRGDPAPETLSWSNVQTGAVASAPTTRLTDAREGPGDGFRLFSRDDKLLLHLPHMGSPIPIAHGVARVFAVGLFNEGELDDDTLDLLDTEFRSVDAIGASPLNADIDGDLSEWSHQRAVAISDVGHVVTQPDLWGGPRDASLSVAARRWRGEVLLAVRVRDDQLMPGDHVTIELGPGLKVHLDLGQEDACPALSRCVEDDSALFGRAFELALPAPGRHPSGPADQLGLPLVIRYADRDANEPLVELASAPSLQALTLALSLSPSDPS
jgi:hypothetical protein